MEYKKYELSPEEFDLIKKYDGYSAMLNDPFRYDSFSKESLKMFCILKDRSNDIFCRRFRAAREVIDLLAIKAGIDPDKTDKFLYALNPNGSSDVADKIEEFISRSGEKAKLKKRVDELERENSVLRSLLQK